MLYLHPGRAGGTAGCAPQLLFPDFTEASSRLKAEGSSGTVGEAYSQMKSVFPACGRQVCLLIFVAGNFEIIFEKPPSPYKKRLRGMRTRIIAIFMLV